MNANKVTEFVEKVVAVIVAFALGHCIAIGSEEIRNTFLFAWMILILWKVESIERHKR